MSDEKSFKKELSKIKAKDEQEKAAKIRAHEEYLKAEERKRQELNKYVEQVSSYLNTTIKPILDEINEVMLNNEGSIDEEKYQEEGTYMDGIRYPAPGLSLEWDFEEHTVGYYSDAQTYWVCKKIEIQFVSKYRKSYFRVFGGDAAKAILVPTNSGNWKKKIEDKITKIFRDKEY